MQSSVFAEMLTTVMCTNRITDLVFFLFDDSRNILSIKDNKAYSMHAEKSAKKRAIVFKFISFHYRQIRGSEQK